MKSFFRALCSIVLLISLSACSNTGSTEQPEEPTETMSYDQNSWETMIDDSCLSYFDGCNNCHREAGSDIAACTRKFCAAYEKPRCLDGEQSE